jgi:DNA invertase Pin-like site-specific DNA recombinase
VSHYLVYVRRSYRTAGDADVSDEAQISASLAMLPPGATHEVIADSGGHNSGRTADRDGMRELVRRIEAGSCDGVAVYDLSRLFRNARHLLNLHHAIDAAGIPLLVAMLPGSRFDTAAGRFLLTSMAATAQYQADMDSERARDIRRALYEDGYHRGHAPYGYRSERADNRRVLVVDEERAPIVRRIFEEVATRSYADIAADLEREGAPSPSVRGWSRYSVRDIHLRGKVYLGLVVLRRGIDERPGRHEPIITPEAYRASLAGARVRDKGGRRSAPGRSYLLSGILRCDCGHRMVGHVGRSATYYMCRRCPRPMVRAESYDDHVLSTIGDFRMSARAMAEMRDMLRSALAMPDTGLLERQRRKLEGRLTNLRKQHSWGDLTDAEYRREKAETEEMLSAIPDESKIVQFDAYAAHVYDVREALPHMTPDERKETVRLFVESMTLDYKIEWSGPYRAFLDARVDTVSPEGSERTVSTRLRWYTEATHGS